MMRLECSRRGTAGICWTAGHTKTIRITFIVKILDKISEKFKKKLEIFSELCYNNSIKTAAAAWAAASGQKPEDKMKRLAEKED